jgi:hypothetical protein
MFLEKDTRGWVVFSGFLTYALMHMLIQAVDGLLNKALVGDFSGLVLAGITEAIF